MSYHAYIDINEARINYELSNHGMAVVIVPSDVSQEQIDDAISDLQAKFTAVKIDQDGDIIITA